MFIMTKLNKLRNLYCLYLNTEWMTRMIKLYVIEYIMERNSLTFGFLTQYVNIELYIFNFLVCGLNCTNNLFIVTYVIFNSLSDIFINFHVFNLQQLLLVLLSFSKMIEWCNQYLLTFHQYSSNLFSGIVMPWSIAALYMYVMLNGARVWKRATHTLDIAFRD